MDNDTIQKLFEQILQAARSRGMTPAQCRAKAQQNFGFLWARLWENAASLLEHETVERPAFEALMA
jgi:hypothetical protein